MGERMGQSVSVAAELEALESQLELMKEDVAKYKKAARLWKACYKQERTARYVTPDGYDVSATAVPCRLATEQRANDLQQLVDEMFKQFDLEDSEDDSFEEPSSASDSSASPHRTAVNDVTSHVPNSVSAGPL